MKLCGAWEDMVKQRLKVGSCIESDIASTVESKVIFRGRVETSIYEDLSFLCC